MASRGFLQSFRQTAAWIWPRRQRPHRSLRSKPLSPSHPPVVPGCLMNVSVNSRRSHLSRSASSSLRAPGRIFCSPWAPLSWPRFLDLPSPPMTPARRCEFLIGRTPPSHIVFVADSLSPLLLVEASGSPEACEGRLCRRGAPSHERGRTCKLPGARAKPPQPHADATAPAIPSHLLTPSHQDVVRILMTMGYCNPKHLQTVPDGQSPSFLQPHRLYPLKFSLSMYFPV